MKQIYQVRIHFCLWTLLFSAPLLQAVEEDSYPVENERLTKYYGGIGSRNCHSFNKAWFVNEKGDQALVIGLHAGHKNRFLHFNPGNIPDVVLKFIDLHYRKQERSGYWKLLPLHEKRRCMGIHRFNRWY